MFSRLSLLLSVAAVAASAQVQLPEGKGKQILDSYCQECHGLDSIVNQSLSAADWKANVQSMVRRGATLKPADVDVLVEYLTTYFGPEKTNINTAESAQMQKAFGITQSEAELLIQYRKANGPLKDWTDLVKANEALARKMEPKRDSVAFH